MLDDGTYDVVVIDAELRPEDDDTISVELTVVDGPAKGQVVSVAARGLAADPFDLLGLPGTLSVTDGNPALRLERGGTA